MVTDKELIDSRLRLQRRSSPSHKARARQANEAEISPDDVSAARFFVRASISNAAVLRFYFAPRPAALLAAAAVGLFWWSLFLGSWPVLGCVVVGYAVTGLRNHRQLTEYATGKARTIRTVVTLAAVQANVKRGADTPIAAFIFRCVGWAFVARPLKAAALVGLRAVSYIGCEAFWLLLELTFLPALMIMRVDGIHPIYRLRMASVALSRVRELLYGFYLLDVLRGDSDGYLNTREFSVIACALFYNPSSDAQMQEIADAAGLGDESAAGPAESCPIDHELPFASFEQVVWRLVSLPPVAGRLNIRQFVDFFLLYTVQLPQLNFDALMQLYGQMLFASSGGIEQLGAEQQQPALTRSGSAQLHSEWPMSEGEVLKLKAEGKSWTNQQTRQYYNLRVSGIATANENEWKHLSLEERARRSSSERHAARMVARVMMSNADDVFNLQVLQHISRAMWLSSGGRFGTR